MNLLEEARNEINAIDEEMAKLFTRRMHAVQKVASYKLQNGKPIFDPVREKQVIERNAESLEDRELYPYYVDFLKNSMRVSRAYQALLLEKPHGCRRALRMELGEDSYDILIERGLLRRAGELLKLDRRVLIVTDSGVPASYAKTVAAQVKSAVTVTLPQGEESKNVDRLKELWQVMLENEFTRSDCVVAVGGGVVGDLAGFAAATYMRGIDFYNLPTTLLSQVDSSIGGKVAVDFEQVKNIVGAFYQPRRVLIDPDVLKTLEPRQFSAGMAEAIKMAMTSDSSLFELISEGVNEETVEEIIFRALSIKKAVVEEDEKEGGLRRILNFGHTLGHGIETESGLGGLLHGECVALGMIPMCSDAVRARLIPVLQSLHLPTSFDCDLERVLQIAGHDKKRSGNDLNVVFVDEIGSFRMEKQPIAEWKELIRKNLKREEA